MTKKKDLGEFVLYYCCLCQANDGCHDLAVVKAVGDGKQERSFLFSSRPLALSGWFFITTSPQPKTCFTAKPVGDRDRRH